MDYLPFLNAAASCERHIRQVDLKTVRCHMCRGRSWLAACCCEKSDGFCAGAGLGGIPHKFFYPDEKEDYAVLQFGSPAAVGSGLANYVQEAAAAAIKVCFPSSSTFARSYCIWSMSFRYLGNLAAHIFF